MWDIRSTSSRASRRRILGAAAGFALSTRLSRSAGAQLAAEWRNMSVEGSPPARWDHTLAADDENRRLIVFGGRGADFAPFGDTWAYSFADRLWSQVDS